VARTYRLGPLRKAVNSVLTASLKAGVGPKSTYLLTTTGRRSGLSRTTPVTLVEDRTGRWLVAPYGNVSWVYNVRASSAVELRRGRRRERLSAEEVDAAAAGPVLRRYVRSVPVTRPYFDAGLKDPEAAFAAEAPRHPVFRLEAVGSGRAQPI
jgi:deazaflavin-dependent oxidoreductase (nitroreductase family)